MSRVSVIETDRQLEGEPAGFIPSTQALVTSNEFFTERHRCPVCASERLHQLNEFRFTEPPIRDYLEDFYLSQGTIDFELLEGAMYALNECQECSLIFQRSIPNDALMHIIYEEWIDPEIAFSSHVASGEIHRHSRNAQEILQLMGSFDRSASSLRFFDFGMGWAEWAIMAKALGCESLGTELSIDRLEHAETNGIRIIAWDEIPGLNCDVINVEQVFEHIAEPAETLLHLGSGLRVGGLLKIGVPKGSGIKRRLKRMDWGAAKGSRHSLNPVAPLEHINCFNRRSLEELARVGGLEVTSLSLGQQYRFMTDWSGPRSVARNAIKPLLRIAERDRGYVLLKKTI
jgi:hypothetical protein